ncbi:MAG: 16S rRNA (adenine(1518)-N(6)/adenine(1519)-N(6))-dimethyltransferase RsmA [Eubacteriaceae bacterium]|nr:16S rRNA (adenine(1518)-N(6)/adenine(1519)-N(6))-dimethyltransferase RsmA [Eubacteriaceae bacterium]
MKDLTSISYISENMKKSGFFFKKNLGQNFLKESSVAKGIVASLELNKEDTVLEIGPGFGALTGFLCGEAGKVKALEIDPFAAGILKEALSEESNVEIIIADALKCDYTLILAEDIKQSRNLKAVSNLPYYITSPAILKLLKFSPKFESIVVMIQREVSARLYASPGTKDYSAFGALVSYFAKCEKLFDVSRNCFMPVPGVDSCVIKLTPLSEPPVKCLDEKTLFEVIKAAFSMRRKTLLNCVCSYFGFDKPTGEMLLEKSGITPSVRGEVLGLEEFARLADEIFILKG